jgi:hypothetical protein
VAYSWTLSTVPNCETPEMTSNIIVCETIICIRCAICSCRGCDIHAQLMINKACPHAQKKGLLCSSEKLNDYVMRSRGHAQERITMSPKFIFKNGHLLQVSASNSICNVLLCFLLLEEQKTENYVTLLSTLDGGG